MRLSACVCPSPIRDISNHVLIRLDPLANCLYAHSWCVDFYLIFVYCVLYKPVSVLSVYTLTLSITASRTRSDYLGLAQGNQNYYY